jgi:hypothetical protein
VATVHGEVSRPASVERGDLGSLSSCSSECNRTGDRTSLGVGRLSVGSTLALRLSSVFFSDANPLPPLMTSA